MSRGHKGLTQDQMYLDPPGKYPPIVNTGLGQASLILEEEKEKREYKKSFIQKGGVGE